MEADRIMSHKRKSGPVGRPESSPGAGVLTGRGTGRFRPNLYWIFLLSFLAVAPGGTAFALAESTSRVIDRIVAVVNGEVITLSEMDEAKARNRLHLDIPDPVRVSSTDSDPAPTDREILNRLIDQKLQVQMARKNGIEVEPSEVDKLLAEIRNNGRYYTETDLQEALGREQLSLDRYRKDVENEIMILKLANREIKSGIFIDQKELRVYYDDHQDRFRMPDSVHLRQILLRVQNEEQEPEVMEKARQLVARIRAGEDFQMLAKGFSEGPDAKDGGDLGFLEKDHLLPAVSQALNGLEAGGLTDPVRTAVGVQIFRVEELTEGKFKPFESVEDEIRDTLYQEQALRRYEAWLQTIRNSAQVEIKF
jgi:peptidyl-prolyl cis-trans isomerase SurA